MLFNTLFRLQESECADSLGFVKLCKAIPQLYWFRISSLGLWTEARLVSARKAFDFEGLELPTSQGAYRALGGKVVSIDLSTYLSIYPSDHYLSICLTTHP